MKRYEAMFLFDTAATRDWTAVEGEVRRLLERIGARLLVCVKYDERKLAYEIKRRKRGTYVLTYFEAPPDRVAALERDARLSELVLRVLVLRADHVSEQKLAQLQAHPADVPLSPASEGRRHEDERHAVGRRPPRPRSQAVEAPDRAGPAPEEEAVEQPVHESWATNGDEE